MFRKAIANKIEGVQSEFRFRGHEVKRVEAFSDAVFAFAVTLLIVVLEVPKNFEELMVTMSGFFAFGASFPILMFIWYEQNIFFRHNGLDDLKTIVLNCILIFLVLFYVYPLKFLFTLMLGNQTSASDHSPLIISDVDEVKLMVIYGLGFISIYLLFSFMYRHVLNKAHELDLTGPEIFDMRTKLYKNFTFMSIGIAAIAVSLLLSPAKSGLGGSVYALIGPALSIFFSYRAKRKRILFHKA
jgi:uncharacterized membrane protein